MTDVAAYAVPGPRGRFVPTTVRRREPGPSDVVVAIRYCGICHSDVHQARDEWGGGAFPMVPGHEIVGQVVRVGAEVRRFRIGDLAGVGCFVDSCRRCDPCRRGLEQHCERGPAFTYNSTEMDRRTPTHGGYSRAIVVDERYVLRIPPGQELASVAPLLCAGITTWSPLRRWKVGRGTRVGVVGLGGLGHMAVKLAAALEAEVTLFSTSAEKAADARRLGAHDLALTRDPGAFQRLAGRLDLVLDTVSAPHEVGELLGTLRLDGTLVLLGVPPEPSRLDAYALIGGRRSIAGSLIGGIAETQELLDLCAERHIGADVEVIPVQQLDEAYDRMVRGDVRYRFVLDLASLQG